MPEQNPTTPAQSPAPRKPSSRDDRNVWIFTLYIISFVLLLALIAFYVSQYATK